MSDEYSPWFSRLALFGLRAFTPQVPAQCYNRPGKVSRTVAACLQGEESPGSIGQDAG